MPPCGVLGLPVRRTVEHDLPKEIDYIRRHDEAITRIMDMIEMPDRLAQNLIMFIRQNSDTLSKRRREKEFSALTDDEVQRLEKTLYRTYLKVLTTLKLKIRKRERTAESHREYTGLGAGAGNQLDNDQQLCSTPAGVKYSAGDYRTAT